MIQNVELSVFKWSSQTAKLVIGCNKGQILLYSDIEKRKIPIVGKHVKQILCVNWCLYENVFATCSSDKTVIIIDVFKFEIKIKGGFE